jgi:hypothetical protein
MFVCSYKLLVYNVNGTAAEIHEGPVSNTNKFYDFKTNVHLIGFYSVLSLMMHGTMNVKKSV